MTKKFFIYQHLKEDDGTVFYVGKGTVKRGGFERAYYKKKRSTFWNAIVEKHGLKVEIVDVFETEAEAFQKESELIKKHGRRCDGGTLCNLTLGGEGHSGHTPSEETKRKLSDLFSGERHPNWGKKLSQETCLKKSESLKNSPHSLKGKKLPDWWKKRISETKFGERNPMYGRTGVAHPSARTVIHPYYGLIFCSVQEAADFLGMDFRVLHNQLSGHRKNKTNMEFANGL